MRALFVGLGAVGQRHLRNLKTVCPDRLEITALRSRKANRVIQSDMATQPCDDLASFYGIQCCDNWEEALRAKPEIAFITNPSSLHMAAALALAKAGVHLFIEKPLSVNLEGVRELRLLSERNPIVVFVGFQMRFYSLLRKVKDLLRSKKIGRRLYARVKFGTFLPAHHPYEDYRMGYAAREDLGGGAVMCLIHEIDYLVDLFGFPQEVMACGGKLSDLEMSAEDTANALLRYPDRFSVNLVLCFAERNEERSLEVVGDKGKIELDLLHHDLKWYDAASGQSGHETLNNFDRNPLFLEEMRHFLECVREHKRPVVDLEDGIQSLKIGLAIKESFQQNKVVQMGTYA